MLKLTLLLCLLFGYIQGHAEQSWDGLDYQKPLWAVDCFSVHERARQINERLKIIEYILERNFDEHDEDGEIISLRIEEIRYYLVGFETIN